MCSLNNMKKIALIISCVLYAAVSFGQTQIKGKLVDKDSKEPMPAAAVALLKSSDSSVVQTAITDNNGNFTMSGMGNGSFRVFVTFIGYKPVYRAVTISSTAAQQDLGMVPLSRKGLALNEVEIVQEKPPVVVKQDTLEFNAGSFKTRENAMVEDLVKKLPGVTVDKDGTVTAQGQQVTRILVDGKPFFGTDPKMATKNLPADIVDKVQIIDRKSDQAQFTGIDDGNIEKAINIVLKPEKRKGYFGRAQVGGGTDDHFMTNVTANRFRDNQQLSFIGGGNNVNNLGYTQQDVFNFNNGNGGGGRGGGGGTGLSLNSGSNGITRNWNGGLNFNQDFNTKLKVNASYFYNDSKTKTAGTSSTQYFLQDKTTGVDSSYFTDIKSSGTAGNKTHTVNLRLEYAPDSMNSVIFTPTFVHNDVSNDGLNDTRSFDTTHVNLLNSKAQHSTSEGSSPNISGNLLFRHKFAKQGRTFSANFNGSYQEKEATKVNNSIIGLAGANSTYSYDTINQQVLQHSVVDNEGVRLNYTEPIFKNRFLELAYNYTTNHNRSNQVTHDFDPVSGHYSNINDSLTNSFDNTTTTQLGSVNIRTQKLKYGYTIGVSVQQNDLQSHNLTKDSTVRLKTVNFFPVALFNYNFTKGKRLQFTYRGSTSQPSLSQLQPVPDNSDPLHVQLGNPDLKPSFTHNIQARYNNFNQVTMHGIFANLNASFYENQIVNKTTNDGAGRQITQPVNINGNYNLSGFMTNIIPIKGQQQSRLNFSTNGSYAESHSYSGNVIGKEPSLSTNKSLNVKENVRFDYTYKELFDFMTTGSVNWNNTASTLQSATNYFDYEFTFDFNVNLPLGFIIGSDVDYTVTTGRTGGYNQQITMLNGFVSKSVFKKKTGLIKLQGFDLLRQNVSISRTVNDNYIQDANNMVLQRYFMISFTYFLNKFGQQQQSQGPRGPGGRGMGFPGGGGGGMRRGGGMM